MAQKSKGLEELFHDTLKDIYFAEKKILATLPKIGLHPVWMTPA
jgi:ferritin-like metal-binding protein YciE